MTGPKSVFHSVFPSSRLKDLAPTPAATPVLDQTEFGQSFGEPIPASIPLSPSEGSGAYPEQVIWDRAWHSATSFLSLPGRDFVSQRQQQELNAFRAHYSKGPRNAIDSIRYVTSKRQADPARQQKEERESIVQWYTDHVRGHFLAYSKGALCRVSST